MSNEAPLRSPTGASAGLLMAARRSEVTLLTIVALALEYEAACQLAEHRLAAGLDLDDVGAFIDGVLAIVEPAPIRRRFAPLGGVDLDPHPRVPVGQPPKFDR
jgi:hypothetical protein